MQRRRRLWSGYYTAYPSGKAGLVGRGVMRFLVWWYDQYSWFLFRAQVLHFPALA